MHRLLPTSAPVSLEDPYEGLALPGTGWTVVGMVESVDGGTAVDGRSGGLGGAGDLAAFRALRSLADVVLVGAGTVRAEDYGPPVARAVAGRRARGQTDAPRLAVVTGTADLDPQARLFADPDRRPLVLTTRGADPARRTALEAVAEVLVLGDERVSPAAAVQALHERGLHRIVCEGGPRLNADLLDAEVVDELFLTIAPTLLGDVRRRLVGGALRAPVGLVLHEVRVHGSELVLRYRVLPRG